MSPKREYRVKGKDLMMQLDDPATLGRDEENNA